MAATKTRIEYSQRKDQSIGEFTYYIFTLETHDTGNPHPKTLFLKYDITRLNKQKFEKINRLFSLFFL